MVQAHGVHSQLFACADFTHRPVADDKNLTRPESCSLLDFVESRFFGEYVATVGKINFLDGGLAVEPQSFHFCMLCFRFAKADDEISNATFRKKAQERQRSAKKRELADRTVEVGFARGTAHGFWIFRAEAASHFRINVAQHRVRAEGAHAYAVDGIRGRLESCRHHGLRSMMVGGTDALSKAVIERVIQVKDDAADARTRVNLFFAFWAAHQKIGSAIFKATWLVLTRQTQGHSSPGCYNSNMEAKLLHIPWLVSVLYSSIPLFWFAIHPFAGPWRKMRRSPYLLLLPIWAAIIFILAWMTWPWHSARLYSSAWMWLPGAILIFSGLKTYAGIPSKFGSRKLSGEAELRPQEHAQELVTTGLHARMRHPIYAAHLLSLTGWSIGSGLAVSFILLAVNALVTFPLMVWMEEQELEKRFGQRFRDYKARVPLFPLPFQRTSA
jgi:protein-S-isoprenylcysteine O-methyltransferase Ste14